MSLFSTTHPYHKYQQLGGMSGFYRGSTSRQVGGGLFGSGWRQAIPYLFKKVLEALKPTIKDVGHHALRATASAAGDIIESGVDNLKDKVVSSFKREGTNLKRKYIDPLVGQRGAGSSPKKKRATKPAADTKKESKPRGNKQPAKKKGPAISDIFSRKK